MMKKICIASYDLDYGGIEKALINLLKHLSEKEYEITLILQHKKGVFLKQIPQSIKIEEYKISKCKNLIIRKIINRTKMLFYIIKNKNKYNASICFATYDIPSTILTRYNSKNNIYWVHGDYYYIYDQNHEEIKHFFNKRKVNKFANILFVSNESRNNFLKVYPNLHNKTKVINNLIDKQEIINKAQESINIKKNQPTIVFIGRLEEKSKKITRIIEVANILKKANKNYIFWIIGDGEDKVLYENLITKYNLKDTVKLLGSKSNPYPYLKLADLLLLTSEYEGFPVVFLEALILNKKIVTTMNVSSFDFKIADYATITDKSATSIASAIEKSISNQKIKHFDSNKFNSTNLKLLENMLGDKNEI